MRLLREELQLLMEPGSYVGEVVKAMGKTKVLVKVQPEGKYSAYSVIPCPPPEYLGGDSLGPVVNLLTSWRY